MATVPSSLSTSNNGLADLLQTLTNENSPLLSAISTPGVEAALQKAPASDIVEISDQAIQLQTADALFGLPNTSTTPTEAAFGLSNTSSSATDSLFSALATAGSSATSSASGSSLDTGSSLSDQLAAYQGNAQTQETQALFGITPSTNTSSQFDVLA